MQNNALFLLQITNLDIQTHKVQQSSSNDE